MMGKGFEWPRKCFTGTEDFPLPIESVVPSKESFDAPERRIDQDVFPDAVLLAYHTRPESFS
jgi:hypothetical protein